jgi:O-antigen biosynthesis protein WbqP
LKRGFDVIFALLILIILMPILILIALLIKVSSEGPVLNWTDRVGYGNDIFKMPKFRTMRVNTPIVATHLLKNPDQWLTPVGRFLRKSSLDELPQLWSILKGDMSFVGPRPALFNQADLIVMRTDKGIHRLLPGLTGWAQVNGRDLLSLKEKVAYDQYYLEKQSTYLDLKIILLTIIKVFLNKNISH